MGGHRVLFFCALYICSKRSAYAGIYLFYGFCLLSKLNLQKTVHGNSTRNENAGHNLLVFVCILRCNKLSGKRI